MSLFDELKKLGGAVPKAILFVQKPYQAGDSAEKSTNINKNIAALRQVTKAGKSSSIAKRMAKMAPGQVVGLDTIGANLAEGEQMSMAVASELATQNFLRFPVQYNPGSITISASAGRYPDYRSMGDSGARQFTMVEREATTYMNVELIFEDINVQDAFMTENMNPTAANVLDMAGNVIRTGADDNHSVQPQVEALVAMLVHEKTRRVVFFWSQMFFHGVVESVDATYTMFNKLGDPVKAKVNLAIRQAASGDEYKSDDEYWRKAFQAVFKESTAVSSVTNAINRFFG